MPQAEQRRRMLAMRRQVFRQDVHAWAARALAAIDAVA
jgi:trehalose-6-phosphate synthase